MRKIRMVFKVIAGTVILSVSIVIMIAAWNASILRIYGDSMYPFFQKGDVVLSICSQVYKPGDIIAFYHEDKLMTKRVIGISGDVIEIREDGTIFVNNQQLRETYLKKSVKGNCEIDFPYKVPEGMLFVMNDQRMDTVDSRKRAIGCIRVDETVGRCVFRLWPIRRLGWFQEWD